MIQIMCHRLGRGILHQNAGCRLLGLINTIINVNIITVTVTISSIINSMIVMNTRPCEFSKLLT